jgi:hypothetical protein
MLDATPRRPARLHSSDAHGPAIAPPEVKAMTSSARGLRWCSSAALLALSVAAGCHAASTKTKVIPPAPPSISGTVRGVASPAAKPIAGAQVCVEGTTVCATSASDGTYALGGITPAAIFVSASAAGYLPGETRQAVMLAAGEAVTGVDLTLSGRPDDTATYVGSGKCSYCHRDVASTWRGSAHFKALDRSTRSVDVTGWPAAPLDCAGPVATDSLLGGTDPVVGEDRELYLVRWAPGCGAGKPEFAMAFDTDASGAVDDGDTVIPVTASVGGVATGAGQCGNGGMLPADATCNANPGGNRAVDWMGWWQQEYLTDIGGSAKPAWVTWDTSGTPADALVMPLAWNQRTRQWVAAPDYNTAQDGTWSKACAGCHEAGLALAVDGSGFVTRYSAASPELGCEKCHGPASQHLEHGDPRFIVNPRYLTAQAEREVCAQCHSQGVASASPAGAFGFAWNDQAAVGGGNFIPGVHQLSDFLTGPSFADPDFYWPAKFPAADHLTAIDLEASPHVVNASEKLTCGDCHEGHAAMGGPVELARADAASGDRYVFQGNDAALRDDVLCLACHAGRGSFARVALSDTAAYHLSAGGTVQKNGATWTVPAADQTKSADLIATTVTAHMVLKSGCTAPFDPTGAGGAPTGRCGTCHMAKTAFTGSYFQDLAGNNVMGDVSSHTFAVATPDQSLATAVGAASWDAVMPNACGACHAQDRYPPQ